MTVDKKIVGGSLVIPGTGIVRADILVKDGKIAGVTSNADTIASQETIDARGRSVFPGMIDCHVHYGTGSPERDFLTETGSAAIGGITTVITYGQDKGSYLRAFERRKQEGLDQAHVDFSYHFCLMSEEHLGELDKYIENLRISSFKFFMNFRGDEGKYFGIEPIDDGFLFEGLQTIGRHPPAKAVVHAENIEIGWRIRKRLKEEGRDGLAVWSMSKPVFLEVESIRRASYLAKVAKCHLYIAHVTAKESCQELKRLRNEFADLYAETCTHYLTHHMSSPVGNIGKVNPPLRTEEDVEFLWESIRDGTLDVISTDHVPRKFATKKGDIWKCSAGFPGTATLVPVVLDQGHNKRGISLERIAEVLSENPARLFNMYPRKGSLMPGSDADLTIVDLDKKKAVNAGELGSYSDYSLYDGWELRGWPVMTMVRGEVVMRDGRLCGRPGHGTFIPRYGNPLA